MFETLMTVEDSRGYNVKWQRFVDDEGNAVYLTLAYSKDDGLIGEIRDANRLISMGIFPQRIDLNHTTCSIGFNELEQKWYGWSHRAIHGYKIGDVICKDSPALSPSWDTEYLKMHPEADKSLPLGFVARSIADCKQMAIAYAEGVS